MEIFNKHNIDDNLILEMADYILTNQTTIRATAKYFNIPKSTVHNYLTVRLKNINHSLHKQIQTLMEKNFNIKHIHGGESTKRKYEKLKENINVNDKFDIF